MTLKRIIKYIRAIILYPYYCCYRSKVSITTYIRKGTIPKDSIIGKYCWINTNVGLSNVNIGNYCSIASQVLIGGMEHPVSSISTSTLLNSSDSIKYEKTTIGHNVWIAAQCVIKQGVSIGNGAVIGANSFVNTDVPPYAVVVGSPAKIVRFRFDKSMIENIENSQFWEFSPNKAREIIASIESNH